MADESRVDGQIDIGGLRQAGDGHQGIVLGERELQDAGDVVCARVRPGVRILLEQHELKFGEYKVEEKGRKLAIVRIP